MKIAELRHIVHLQRATVTVSARGSESVSWVDSPPLRASIRTLGGDERSASEQVIQTTQHEVTLRWPLPSGMTASTKQRVKWVQGGTTRYFGITAIDEPDNRKRLIVLVCTELVGETRGI